MPIIWERDISKVGVQVHELVPNFFPSYNALKMKIARTANCDYGIKRLQRGGGADTQVLIDFDTLPREIKEDLGDPRKCTHLMEKWYNTDAQAVRFYNRFQFENQTYLSDKHKEEYMINASVLQAVHIYKQEHITERAKKGKAAKKIYLWMANEAQAFQKVLKTKFGVQHTLPSSERQFRTVYDGFFSEMEYEGQKYDCNYIHIISGKLQNENAKVVNDKISALLDSIFAKAGTKPNKLMVARRYQAFMDGVLEVINTGTGENYSPADFKPLSDRSITKWLSKWESRIGTHALRSGDRIKLRGDFSVAHELDKPLYAGSLISVDDRQPPFEYSKGERLWVYNCLDVASDAITATVWGKTKEGLILNFYRQILRNYTEWNKRLPAELEAEVSLNNSFKETFLKEGAMFDYVRLEANNPRGKIIERRNRDFRLVHEKELKGWIGRWHARDESNQPLPASNIYKEQKYTPYDQLVQQSLMVIEDWNNMPHPNNPEMSRWDYFVNNQNPQLHPTNWKAILPYLGYATKSSCNVGKIRLQGGNMMIGDNGEILFGENLINRLKIVEGQDVTLYWLDGNDGNVLKALVYIGDTYICEAISTPKYNRARIERTEQDEYNLQLQAKYTATVDGFMKDRKNNIDEVILIDHRPKTLNRNFVMPGLNRFTQEVEEAQILDDDWSEEQPLITHNSNQSQSFLNKF